MTPRRLIAYETPEGAIFVRAHSGHSFGTALETPSILTASVSEPDLARFRSGPVRVDSVSALAGNGTMNEAVAS